MTAFGDLLRHYVGRRYLVAQGLSMVGDRALLLALGIWARTLTGSNAAAGLVALMFTAPTLLAPIAGVLVDRYDRRQALVVTNAVLAAAIFALLGVEGRQQIWLLYLTAAIYGSGLLVIATAQSAYIAAVIPERLLPAANSALQTESESSRLLAPLLGAAVFTAFGAHTVVVADAATFMIAVVLLTRLPRAPVRRAVSNARVAFGSELRAGLRHVAGSELRDIVATVAFVLFFAGFAETFIFAVATKGLGRSPAFVGVLASLQGAGAILGGLMAPTVIARIGDRRLVAAGMALLGCGAGATAARSLAIVSGGMLLIGAGAALIIIGLATAVQTRTPQELQGRVYAFVELSVGVPQTLSVALGAALILLVDYRILILGLCVGCLVAAGYLGTHQRRMRR